MRNVKLYKTKITKANGMEHYINHGILNIKISYIFHHNLGSFKGTFFSKVSKFQISSQITQHY